MTTHIDLEFEDVVHQGFADAIQEQLSGSVPNLRIVVLNSTTLQVQAGAGSDQASVAIMGRYRYRTTTTNAALPGGLSDGTHDVFVTASENDFSGPADHPDAPTNYSFGLQVLSHGGTPSTDIYRQVGDVDVVSGAIKAYRQTAGSRAVGSFPVFAKGEIASNPAFVAQGVASQTARIAEVRDSTGAVLFGVNADGTIYVPAGKLAASALSNGIDPGDLKISARTADYGRWLLCDGRELLASDIESSGLTLGGGEATALFTLLGTGAGSKYGAAATSKIKLPDLRGKFPLGISGSHTVGATGGAETHALTAAETAVKGHSHTASQAAHSHTITVTDPGHAHTQAAHSHTITINESPHFHNALKDPSGRQYYAVIAGGATSGLAVEITNSPAGANNLQTNAVSTGITASSSNQTPTINSATTGITASSNSQTPAVTVDALADGADGTAHENMPPYQVAGNWFIRV